MEPPITIPEYPGGGYPGGGYPGGGMMGGGFGYSPNLMRYESQQGAGQVPYYMAAARNSMNPNMSPAFMHAARNYDILGGLCGIVRPPPFALMPRCNMPTYGF